MDLKISGKVEVQKRPPWLAKKSAEELVIMSETLVRTGKALGVDVAKILVARLNAKKATTNLQFKVLDFREVWKEIKRDSQIAPKEEWTSRVFGAPDQTKHTKGKEWTDTEHTMKYKDLKLAAEHGTNWCRQSKVYGMLPSFIVSELRGEDSKIPAVFVDTGLVNFLCGVWKVLKGGMFVFQPFRVTGHYYHQRVGLNRIRERVEKNGNAPLSWEDRVSTSRAKDRRLVEEGKRQLYHEILGGWRLFSDTYGDGRDFAAIIEFDSKGGGNSHRKPATQEFIFFLSQFILVGKMNGYNTSQFCSRCGGRLQFANNREIRTKCCSHPECKGISEGERMLHVDRDVNAAMNFALIDEAEARGEERPLRFQSNNYKSRRQNNLPFANF